MRCPYLKETNVKLCRNSAWRTMIIRDATVPAEEKCSTGSYTTCAIYQQHDPDAPADPPCPHLEDKRAEYCAAAPAAKFVPQSEVASRCKRDCHRYCELFRAGMPRRSSDDMEMPERLYYSANHLWFDPAPDGGWHVGIDALLAKVVGPVDAVTFVTLAGVARPAVVLHANGLDLEVVFPNPLTVTGANLHLRADPSCLTSDPYAVGWLFEGEQHGDREVATLGLMHGLEVVEWMRKDLARISESMGGDSMADGGVPCDVLRGLERDRALPLFHEFFSLARVGSGR